MHKIQVKITDDGSTTLYHTALDEHYHSVFGAVQEAKHVYIQAGLEAVGSSPIHLLEIGFGTGLNALLSWQWAEHKQHKIHYTSIEYYPIQQAAVDKLYFGENNLIALQALHSSVWEQPVEMSACFTLKKVQANLLTCHFTPMSYDLVYYDAFAPDKQPEMWSEAVLKKVALAMRPQAVFVTYSTKGTVKQILRKLGMMVKRLPGPPGKRDMLFAKKLEL